MNGTPRRSWLLPICLLPAWIALAWTVAWATRVPEPLAWRLRLLQPPSVHGLAELGEFGGMPAHWLSRVLQLAAVTLAGGDFGRAALGNWLLALAGLGLLAWVLRRVGLVSAGAVPIAVLALAMLLFSPAYAGAFLIHERIGGFGLVVLFLAALRALASARPSGWRLGVASAVAGLAPFCHAHGAAVWLVLSFPVLRWCARSGRRDGGPAVVVLAVTGVLAVLAAQWPVEAAAGHRGLVSALCDAPGTTILGLLRATGECLPDLLPNLNADAIAVGSAVWACLLLGPLAVRTPTPSGLVPICWGLLALPAFATVIDAETHGVLGLSAPMARELGVAGALLGPGLLGMFVACVGRPVLPVAVAAGMVLAVQDWHRGFEQLKIQANVLRRGEAAVAVVENLAPLVPLPVGNVHAVTGLRARGLLPRVPALRPVDLPTPDPTDVGELLRIDGDQVVGRVLATRWRLAPDLVLLVPVEGPLRVIGVAEPQFEDGGKVTPFRLTVPLAGLVDGTRCRAVGLSVRSRQLQPLRGVLEVRGGRLHLEGRDG